MFISPVYGVAGCGQQLQMDGRFTGHRQTGLLNVLFFVLQNLLSCLTIQTKL